MKHKEMEAYYVDNQREKWKTYESIIVCDEWMRLTKLLILWCIPKAS